MGFGDFSGICGQANVPLCFMLGKVSEGDLIPYQGQCFARSVVLANTMVFNIGNLFLELAMIIVIAVIALSAGSKYTAVGRREFLDLNTIFFFLNLFSLVVDSNAVAPEIGPYPYFVAVQSAFTSALCAQTLVWIVTMFQFWEDGTFKAVFISRCGVAIWGLANFAVSLLTFKNWTHSEVIGPEHGSFLMAFLYVANGAFIFLFAVGAVWLTAGVLREWWSLGSFMLAALFFTVGQLFLYQFNNMICKSVKHYIDGKFLATLCNMFAYVLLYKGWDIITTEDLEFSVSPVDNVWDLKSAEEDGLSESEYAMSHYTQQTGML